jgi:hypothetical protein
LKKNKIIILAFVITGVAYLLYSKPSKVKCVYPDYFAALNMALKTTYGGESAGVMDLDRLDHNAELVSRQLGDRYRLRLVTKSLPSVDLLNYLMIRTKTNRLMVFSEPFIAEILQRCNVDSLDILLGKPLPVEALGRLSVNKGWNTIHWLVDTRERLNDYLAFAKKENVRLKVSLEINVGLQRGGLQTVQQLSELVETIKANSSYLELTGLMGYDGHVPYVPFYINKAKAIKMAFAEVQKSYAVFVDELKKHYDDEFIRSLTLNSGGSRTYFHYPEYKDYTPVNEIAMGSGFLAPAEFPELEKLGHQPALFLCSPVLKKTESAKLPHAEKISPLVNWWNPNLKVSYFMLGGGWPGDLVAPAGLQKNPFWEEEGKNYANLLPSQSICSSSDENRLQVGDFVFSQAWEGDGMLCFNKILLYRQYKFIGEWKTYKGGN